MSKAFTAAPPFGFGAQAAPAPHSTLAGPLDLEWLYRHHARQVWNWARRFGAHPSDAQDVMQEVFLVAQRHLSSLRPDGNVSAWLFSITRRVVDQQRQREQRRSRLDEGQGVSGDEPVAKSPEETTLDRLQWILQRMPETLRTVFVLADLEGEGMAHIAELLQVKPARARALVIRARDIFRRQLRELLAIESRESVGR